MTATFCRKITTTAKFLSVQATAAYPRGTHTGVNLGDGAGFGSVQAAAGSEAPYRLSHAPEVLKKSTNGTFLEQDRNIMEAYNAFKPEFVTKPGCTRPSLLVLRQTA